MTETIKEQIEIYKQEFYNTGDGNIFYKLEGIAALILHLEDKHKLYIVDTINIAKEINSLMKTINGYFDEKEKEI